MLERNKTAAVTTVMNDSTVEVEDADVKFILQMSPAQLQTVARAPPPAKNTLILTISSLASKAEKSK